jgi:hypothetical protein
MNMRLFVPALEAVKEDDGQFLFLSSFPRTHKSQPVPDSLLAQVEGRTNLVYYDWELTGYRLQEWQILRKLISNRAEGQSSDAADANFDESQWLAAVARLAGNTVTEIMLAAPKELSVVRKAPLGFTAVELVVMADWFCDANSGPIHPPPSPGSLPPFFKHP